MYHTLQNSNNNMRKLISIYEWASSSVQMKLPGVGKKFIHLRAAFSPEGGLLNSLPHGLEFK